MRFGGCEVGKRTVGETREGVDELGNVARDGVVFLAEAMVWV